MPKRGKQDDITVVTGLVEECREGEDKIEIKRQENQLEEDIYKKRGMLYQELREDIWSMELNRLNSLYSPKMKTENKELIII